MLKKIFVFSLLFVFLFGGQVLAEFNVTIPDDLGHKINLEEKPERIISLAPANTELLFALNLNKEIVGVTTFADYPQEAKAKEKIGTITEPNIEKIISLEPDLILANSVNKMESIERLRELGCKVVAFDARTVNDTISTIKVVGKLTGQEELAQKIVTDMFLQLAEIKSLVDNKLEECSRPKVFYEIWNQPLYTAGKNTFIDDIINIAGGINIGAEAKGAWPQYSLEKLLLENPDIYISSPHSAPHKVSVGSIKNRDNYGSLNAVKNDRIYIMNQDIINRASPRIITGLKKVVKAIFPDLAPEIDKI